MAKQAASVPASKITIDVRKDLSGESHLKALLHTNLSPLLMIGSEALKFAGKPIRAALNCPAISITVLAPGVWTTSPGIRFALASSARCNLSVSATSTNFSAAADITSTQTEELVSGPVAGKTYINLQLDFSLSASVSGSGAAGALGISGKGTNASVTTLSYCHPADSGVEALAAIREAFDLLIFPFEPNCAKRMPVASLGRVSFDGSLGFSFGASYGLGSLTFAGPSVDTAKQSLVAFRAPSVAVSSGAAATLQYDHTDHFTAIVSRTTSTDAFLTLMRSSDSEVAGSVGISIGVTSSKADVHIDKQQLGTAVNAALGGGGNQVAALTDHLQAKLESKTAAWFTDISGNIGLAATLARQHDRAILYKYRADLTRATLEQSWTAFAQGDLRQAVRDEGLQLMPGSAVSDFYQRSFGLNLELFNFSKASDKNLFFKNSRAEVSPEGALRFFYDVGRERDSETQKAMQLTRMHFVATAAQSATGDMQNVSVDFVVELSSSGHLEDRYSLGSLLGLLPQNEEFQRAQTLVRGFASGDTRGTLSLLLRMKPSAFQRFDCSHFSGPLDRTPPPLPQSQDAANWAAFRLASEVLLDISYVRTLTYADWIRFNQMCNDGRLSSSYVPNRRHIGDLGAITPGFYPPAVQKDANFITFFLRASTQFMNLCDDLHSLAGLVAKVDTAQTWDSLLQNLTEMSTADTNIDWSRPAVGALLQLCCAGNAGLTAIADPSGLSCVVNVA